MKVAREKNTGEHAACSTSQERISGSSSMDQNKAKIADDIEKGRCVLGIELGSTRIKAVLIGTDLSPVAAGNYDWENRLEDGFWTYRLDDVWQGIRGSYQALSETVKESFGLEIRTLKAMGISAMMHGYLAFDASGELLAPFRTWRNTTTEKAAFRLTNLFRFNIPQRWSIAHLYQAILDGESHVNQIRFFTTLAGYVHWRLTGEQVLGVGDASGMFPIDSQTGSWHEKMLDQFDELAAEQKPGWKIRDLLPGTLPAGAAAGTLTKEGALLLDPSGTLSAGVALCPPEGDAGTGMVATGSVAARTGNISAGTSLFAMIVLEKYLSTVYKEIDMVTTPSGKPVAMVHCNNCTSDLDAWVRLFDQTLELAGVKLDRSDLYNLLYRQALEGDMDCGGILSYNYYSGEPITDFEEGRPLLIRMPDGKFSLANFMRAMLFSAMGTLRIGMEILTEREKVDVDQLLGHGGFFKVEGVGQRFMAAALGIPVVVMEMAGEGGAWGIALLAAYSGRSVKETNLEDWLAREIFDEMSGTVVAPADEDRAGFQMYMDRYVKGLTVERAAVMHLQAKV